MFIMSSFNICSPLFAFLEKLYKLFLLHLKKAYSLWTINWNADVIELPYFEGPTRLPLPVRLSRCLSVSVCLQFFSVIFY